MAVSGGLIGSLAATLTMSLIIERKEEVKLAALIKTLKLQEEGLRESTLKKKDSLTTCKICGNEYDEYETPTCPFCGFGGKAKIDNIDALRRSKK